MIEVAAGGAVDCGRGWRRVRRMRRRIPRAWSGAAVQPLMDIGVTVSAVSVILPVRVRIREFPRVTRHDLDDLIGDERDGIGRITRVIDVRYFENDHFPKTRLKRRIYGHFDF